MTKPNRPEEYSSLREEMLGLQQRAHEVWKWGVVSLLAVAVAALSIFLGVQDDSAVGDHLVPMVAQNAAVLGILLLLFGAAAIATVVQLSATNREMVTRLGAYLAVFHDGASPAISEASKYGWHVWNRIEKVAESRIVISQLPPTRRLAFHGVTRMLIPLFGFYAFLIVLLFTAISSSSRVTMTWAALVVTGSLVIVVEAIETRLRKRTTLWSARWTELANGDSGHITRWLQSAHLVAPSLGPTASVPERVGRNAVAVVHTDSR